jgi:hypothetical protein
MFITTKDDLLRQLPAAWRRAYESDVYGPDKALKLAELEAESSLTEARASEIIGNESWTRNECSECGQDCFVTVTIGQESDYDSETASVCLPCLQKAVALVIPVSPVPAAPVTV